MLYLTCATATNSLSGNYMNAKECAVLELFLALLGLKTTEFVMLKGLQDDAASYLKGAWYFPS